MAAQRGCEGKVSDFILKTGSLRYNYSISGIEQGLFYGSMYMHLCFVASNIIIKNKLQNNCLIFFY
jgi:hypothetical protein